MTIGIFTQKNGNDAERNFFGLHHSIVEDTCKTILMRLLGSLTLDISIAFLTVSYALAAFREAYPDKLANL